MNAQILKGILEGCILSLIEIEETYGYKVVENLNAYGFEVNEATVYPILKRLEKRGLVAVEKKPSPLGPMRKYFSLSQAGEQEIEQFRLTWSQMSHRVESVLKGELK